MFCRNQHEFEKLNLVNRQGKLQANHQTQYWAVLLYQQQV